jgi:hypothetical protein
MNSAPSGYVDFTPYILFWFLAQRQCLAPKRTLITLLSPIAIYEYTP